jgi:hypothetical protein
MSIPNAEPLQTHGMNIEDLFAEAKNWLDGEPIATPEQADAVGKLLDMIRQARKAADEQRKVEKKPHDDAGKAVQEAWNPLLVKCDLALSTCKSALTPWLEAVEARQREEADRARQQAADSQRAAQAALQAAPSTDLTARADAEMLLEEASRSEKAAAKLDKARPQALGESRAIGLRTFYRAEVTDYTAFARWAWTTRRAEYEAFLNDLAEREGRRGPVTIPGLLVHTERKAA